MRIQLPQPIQAPQITAIEIPDNQVKYDPTSGIWTFQVFGVSNDGDVSSLKVQSLVGVIKRFESESVSDSEIDAFLLTEQGSGQTRSQAVMSISLNKLYAFVSAPAPDPIPDPIPDP